MSLRQPMLHVLFPAHGKYSLLNMATAYITDFTRNWCEPRVERLEMTKMYFPKINSELPFINIDSLEKGRERGGKRNRDEEISLLPLLSKS